MRIRVFHQLTHEFAPPAKQLIQTLRLTPRNHEGQYVAHWRIEVDMESRLRQSADAFGNFTHVLSVDGPVERLTLTVDGVVETHDTTGIVRGALERFPPGLYLRETPLTLPDDTVRALAEEIRADIGPEALPFLHGLMNRLHAEASVAPQGSGGPAENAASASPLDDAEGLAHRFIAAARHADIPARYVTGYLWRDNERQSQRGLHAWSEAHVAGLGWIAFDPTVNACPTTAHVRVAVGLDSLGAAPIRASRYGFGEENLDVKVQVMAQSQSQN
ncbi:transglutaminase family protein [Alsobacter sp. SYSU M60028]|uniref:Transglutaminase family protein n=1 Tax=Alsobacter ponti TaxID=2962936 RepID=A0ABT1LHN4_9HYPH|nr:transglutaminase family protein [Alsobacter ponti]MCP8940461.1 transglutaminase family protein [Alsobacter ponti]